MTLFLGQTETGTGTSDGDADSYGVAWKFTALATGTIDTVWLRERGTGSAVVHAAVYAADGAGGIPGTRLSDSETHTGWTDGFNSWTMNPGVNVTSGVAYYLAFKAVGGANNYYNFSDTVGTAYTANTDANPFPATWVNYLGPYSVTVACYAEGSAAPWPPEGSSDSTYKLGTVTHPNRV